MSSFSPFYFLKKHVVIPVHSCVSLWSNVCITRWRRSQWVRTTTRFPSVHTWSTTTSRRSSRLSRPLHMEEDPSWMAILKSWFPFQHPWLFLFFFSSFSSLVWIVPCHRVEMKNETCKCSCVVFLIIIVVWTFCFHMTVASSMFGWRWLWRWWSPQWAGSGISFVVLIFLCFAGVMNGCDWRVSLVSSISFLLVLLLCRIACSPSSGLRHCCDNYF